MLNCITGKIKPLMFRIVLALESTRVQSRIHGGSVPLYQDNVVKTFWYVLRHTN